MKRVDDEIWDDFDEDTIEECIQLENEALSQVPTRVGLQNNQIKNNFPSTSKGKSLVRIKSKDFDKFPTISNFTNAKQNKNNVSSFNKKSYSFPNGSPKKNYPPIPFKGNKSTNGNCVTPSMEPNIDFQALLKEKEAISQENFIKLGEIINLRKELKRKSTSSENERMDHCRALEAAEKRGKEKASKKLTEYELKIKNLQQEVEKLNGNVAFQDLEIKELKKENGQMQNTNPASSSKRKSEKFPSKAKRIKNECTSPSAFSTSFFENFSNKKNVKDAQVQTRQHDIVKSSIIQTKSKELKYRRSFLLNSMGHNMNTIMKQNDHLKEVLLLLERNNKLTSTGSCNYNSDNDVLKSVCPHLESIIDNFPSAFKEKNIDVTNLTTLQYEFNHLLCPLLNALRLINPTDQDLLHRTITILNGHILPVIYKGVTFNDNTATLALENLPKLIDKCSILPVAICTLLRESISRELKLSNGKANVILTRVLMSLMQKNNFGKCICYKTDDCFVNDIVSIVQPDIDKKIRINLFTVIFQLLKSKSEWFEHSCATSLLQAIIKLFYHLTPKITEIDTWNDVVIAIQILRQWQYKDPHWWDRAETAEQTLLAFIGPIIKRCRELEKTTNKDFIWNLLHDMRYVDSDK